VTTCSECRTENAADSAFCKKCGSALASACPKCAAPLAADAEFCSKCGHRIAAAKSGPDRLASYIPKALLAKLEGARTAGGMQGERRTVTILFCDVQGSTAAAGKLDPEDWAEVMNGAFEHLIAPIYRFEGTLARLMGDAVLAFFGAPIAHEDDAERAVLAGLEILRAIGPYRQSAKQKWGVDFDVRVGINTGLVVVGEVGSDLRVEYTAMGDVVNVAARMEQTATPGTVRLAEATQKLVTPVFDLEDLGPVEVKGKAEPVHAFRAIAPKKERGSLRGLVGLRAAMVGRDGEMTALRSALGEVRAGRGRVVSVVGEAGLGKSRLVAELRASDAAQGLCWMEGRCLSYRSSTPYAPFVDLFETRIGLRGEETSASRWAGLSAEVGARMGEGASEVLPFLATMLGIELSAEDAERVRFLMPPVLRAKVFGAVRAYLDAAARQSPVVVVFEDLHWADSTSLDLLQDLMGLTDHAPIAIVGVLRPRRDEASWRFHEVAARDFAHRYTHALLEPLGEGDSRALVAQLLEIEDLPEKVRGLILRKAEGNPFFVEEVIRSLLDSKLVVREGDRWKATREVADVAVPDSLAGVITTRLDQLAEESRRVLQTASVVGREFDVDALAEIHEAGGDLDGALVDLVRREMIREKARLPVRAYLFKHALTQQTAYGTLLLARRRDLHGKIADRLERTAADRHAEIARHLLDARAADRALPHLVAAGEQAAKAYASADAMAAFQQALGLVEESVGDPKCARRAFEGLGGAQQFAGDVAGALATFKRMYAWGVQKDDGPMQVSARNKTAFAVTMFHGDVEAAEKELADAVRVATACGDQGGLAEYHMNYCFIRLPLGIFDEAEHHLGAATRIGHDVGQKPLEVFGLTHTANTLTCMTKFDDAWEMAKRAMALADEIGDREHAAELRIFAIPMVQLRNGDPDAARRTAEEGLAIATRIGAAFPECMGAAMLGQLAHMRGAYEEALAHHAKGLGVARAFGMMYVVPMFLCSQGTIRLDISPTLRAEAEALHKEAIAGLDVPMGMYTSGSVFAEIGFCAMGAGKLDEALALFNRGLQGRSGMVELARPLNLLGSGLVALAQGRREDAGKLLAEAETLVEKAGMKHLRPLIAFAQAGRAAADPDPAAALAAFARAEDLAASMGMRPLRWQAAAAAGGLLAATGRAGDADAARRRARETADAIAADFRDAGMRAAFVEQATVRIGA